MSMEGKKNSRKHKNKTKHVKTIYVHDIAQLLSKTPIKWNTKPNYTLDVKTHLEQNYWGGWKWMDNENKILGKYKQKIISGLVLLLDKVE